MIEEYNKKEMEALVGIPNRIIEACRPVEFNQVGYPHRVNDIRELYKYIDVMQETRGEYILKHILHGLTEREFEAFKYINEIVNGISIGYFNKNAHAINALLGAFHIFRAIESVHPKGRIFEMGAGSGYLGALLCYFGYEYICCDISQAFALWQKIFIERMGGSCMYWWDFYGNYDAPKFDCVTCNHMLEEMHPRAFLFFTKKVSLMTDSVIFEVYNERAKQRFPQVGLHLVKSQVDRFDKYVFEINVFSRKSEQVIEFKSEPKPITWENIVEYINSIGSEKNKDDEFCEYIGVKI